MRLVTNYPHEKSFNLSINLIFNTWVDELEIEKSTKINYIPTSKTDPTLKTNPA